MDYYTRERSIFTLTPIAANFSDQVNAAIDIGTVGVN